MTVLALGSFELGLEGCLKSLDCQFPPEATSDARRSSAWFSPSSLETTAADLRRNSKGGVTQDEAGKCSG